jgi:hypothetical protein
MVGWVFTHMVLTPTLKQKVILRLVVWKPGMDSTLSYKIPNAAETIDTKGLDTCKSMVASAIKVKNITPAGATAVMKAVHPSDANLKSRGMPVSNDVPTVVVTYQGTTIISKPEDVGDGELWDAIIVAAPNPAHFATVTAFKEGGTLAQHFIDNVLLGSDAPGAVERILDNQSILASNFSSWRCEGASMTTSLNAAAIANQGVVSAATLEPASIEFSAILESAQSQYRRPVILRNPVTGIDFSSQAINSQRGSYYGQARDGCYSILKLEQEDFEYLPCITNMKTYGVVDGGTGTKLSDLAVLNGAPRNTYLSASKLDVFVPGLYLERPNLDGSKPMMNTHSNKMMIQRFSGLSSTATLSIKTVMVFGFRVIPSSIFAPFTEPAATADEAAMLWYYHMTEVMNDAYPAYYNSLGDILPYLQKAWKFIAPHLASGAGAVIKGLAPAVMDALPGLILGSSSDKPLKQPSGDYSSIAMNKSYAKGSYVAGPISPPRK